MIRNDYGDGSCYMKPRHIIIEGSQEEMGYELAKIAQRGVGWRGPQLVHGKDLPEHGEHTSRGVRRAFGLDVDDTVHDAT